MWMHLCPKNQFLVLFTRNLSKLLYNNTRVNMGKCINLFIRFKMRKIYYASYYQLEVACNTLFENTTQ